MFTFIETHLFTRIVGEYLPDDEYGELQLRLASNPNLGDLIPGSGGVRKVRWARRGMGKRGGLRVIYYVKWRDAVIWMLTIYGKSQVENIDPKVLARIRSEIDG